MRKLIDELEDFLRRLFNLSPRKKKKLRPSSATNLEVIAMAKDVRFSWLPPTTREDGTPLPATEKKEQRLYVRNAALGDFTLVATVGPEIVERNFPQVPVGTWVYRVVMIDTDNRVGEPADAPPITVRSDSPPAAASSPLAVVL